MLYDDLINIDYKRYPGQDMVASFRAFNDVLKITPKYVLTDNVVQMMETLSWKRPKAILNGLPVCFLPHQKIWVEYYYQDFKDAIARIRAGKELDSIEEAPPPVRMGYLFEELDGGYIQVTLAWKHHNISCGNEFYKELLHLCPVCWVINTAEVWDEKPKVQWTSKLEKDEKDTYMWEFRHSKEDISAFEQLSRRTYPGITRFCSDYLQNLQNNLPVTERRKLEKLIQFDVAGEWRHALAILMILNSRTCVEYNEVDRSKVSKARVRSGKEPTDNYKEVKFKLSRVQYNSYIASGRKLEDLAKHLVAAHLKVRKTGVFLWSAHVRGYRGEIKIPTKIVVP